MRSNIIDIGGGLGIPYRGNNDVPPHPDEYAAAVKQALGGLGLKIVLEPGRMIVGNAGVLVTRVTYVKEGADRTFTIVDAAMNDLIRPTLYEAYHDIWPVAEMRSDMSPMQQDIVGPVCETGDYLAQDRALPPFEAGDLIAVMTAGAYGAVMSSTYNTRPLIPEVLVNGDRYAVVRPRPSYDELIGADSLPPWLVNRADIKATLSFPAGKYWVTGLAKWLARDAVLLFQSDPLAHTCHPGRSAAESRDPGALPRSRLSQAASQDGRRQVALEALRRALKAEVFRG